MTLDRLIIGTILLTLSAWAIWVNYQHRRRSDAKWEKDKR